MRVTGHRQLEILEKEDSWKVESRISLISVGWMYKKVEYTIFSLAYSDVRVLLYMYMLKSKFIVAHTYVL